MFTKKKVTNWCLLAFDIQTSLNPGTNAANDTAVIPGARLKMLF